MNKSILAFLYKEFGLLIVKFSCSIFTIQAFLQKRRLFFLYLFNQKIFLILPFWQKMCP